MAQLARIKAFIEIIERGSIHAAALALCQTDAAISKKLTKLEKILNIKLLERGPGNQRLTEMGAHYYHACKAALEKINVAESFIKQTYSAPEGELTVLVSKYLFAEIIAPKLEHFMVLYPALRLKFNTAERTVNFEKDHIDVLFAIAMPPPNKENLIRRKWKHSTRSVICATRQYLEKHGTPKKPKDLHAHRYLCHCNQYPKNMITFDEGFELSLQPFLEFDETDAIVIAAKQHLGFIAVREFKVTQDLQSGDLVEILPQYNQDKVMRYTYYRQQAFPNPKIQVFLDYYS
jgi:DNA-binding transcriptional LysR family regulator